MQNQTKTIQLSFIWTLRFRFKGHWLYIEQVQYKWHNLQPTVHFYHLLFLCPAREQPSPRMLARSFPSACQWMSLCVHAEGFQQGREMPTKIVFETENQDMEEVVDTAAEAKTLKVSRVSRVTGTKWSVWLGRRSPWDATCLTTCGWTC